MSTLVMAIALIVGQLYDPPKFSPSFDATLEELLWESSDDVSWYCQYEQCDIV